MRRVSPHCQIDNSAHILWGRAMYNPELAAAAQVQAWSRIHPFILRKCRVVDAYYLNSQSQGLPHESCDQGPNTSMMIIEWIGRIASWAKKEISLYWWWDGRLENTVMTLSQMNVYMLLPTNHVGWGRAGIFCWVYIVPWQMDQGLPYRKAGRTVRTRLRLPGIYDAKRMVCSSTVVVHLPNFVIVSSSPK